MAACAVQYAVAPESDIPMVGASGAIAGVLGAYAVTWPRARILTLVPVFVFFMFLRIPALFVLGSWFLMQLLSGAAMLKEAQHGGGIAFGAHIGGFVTGAAIFLCLPKRGKRGGRRGYEHRGY